MNYFPDICELSLYWVPRGIDYSAAVGGSFDARTPFGIEFIPVAECTDNAYREAKESLLKAKDMAEKQMKELDRDFDDYQYWPVPITPVVLKPSFWCNEDPSTKESEEDLTSNLGLTGNDYLTFGFGAAGKVASLTHLHQLPTLL